MPKSVSTPEYFAVHTYLDARMAEHPKHVAEKYDSAAGVLGFGLAVGGWFLLRPELGWFWTIVALIAGLSFYGSMFRAWLKRKMTPTTSSQRWRAQVFAAIDQYQAVRGNRRLAKCLDPVAGQVMEAAASCWMQIRAILNGTLWSADRLTDHQAQIRAEALEAADAAMDEIVVLCANCLGEPKKTRADEAKNLVSDLQDLRLGDAMERLGRIATSDDPAFTHQSPNLAAVFPTIRTLAEKLHQLSNEVNRMAHQAAVPNEIGLNSVGLNRIDSLIQNLQAQRIAEQELQADPDDPVQQRLGR